MQKLELTWIGKDDAQAPLEPRILIENPQYSYGTVEETTLPSGKPWHGNMLIHGDNLLALRSLATMYAGEVKCIYIDPPYNTGNAFEHYDDNLEHSIWLGLMYKRIELLYTLLREDGVFCMHLDDDEVHYAKVICDEIFGRKNFICTVAIKSSTPSGVKTAHRDKKIIKQKDLMLVYKKSDNLLINPQYISRLQWDSHYSLFLIKDGDNYILRSLSDVLYEQGITEERIPVDKLDINDKKFKSFYIANKESICRLQSHKNGEAKKFSIEHHGQVVSFISKDGNKSDLYYNGQVITPLAGGFQTVVFNREIREDLGMLLCDFWSDIDFQNTQNEGGVDFPTSKKPEALVYRALSLFSNNGDIVLDSFLGSGTTTAVAQKMNRKYIGVELGQHAYTHCFARQKNVVDGSDKSGMSSSLCWQGGGGFKFYELAPSLLKHDEFGQLVINPEYNADQLAAAMAMQEGYTYAPSSDTYWKQGYGSEQDYIFTTTQFLTAESIDRISESMAEGESLLICCTACQKEARNRHANVTVKKIPQMLLKRCEFDRENYNLNIICPPQLDDIEDAAEE